MGQRRMKSEKITTPLSIYKNKHGVNPGLPAAWKTEVYKPAAKAHTYYANLRAKEVEYRLGTI